MIIKPEMILSNLPASYLMRNYDCKLPITCLSFAGSLETEKKNQKFYVNGLCDQYIGIT